MNILHLDSSILGANSASRALSADIVARQKALHPGAAVVYHDLVADSVGHLTHAHLAVFQGAEPDTEELGADVKRGSVYIDELLAADVIVIGAPMYNFTIPTQLKAWIDRVLVAGRTFRYGPNGPEGLIPGGKRVFVAATRGGFYSNADAAALEHQESYLAGALGWMGLTDVTFIRAEGLAVGDDAKKAALQAAHGQIAALTAQ